MKNPTPRITGIEKGEETQVKDTENTFNKITEDNFHNLIKVFLSRYKKPT